MDKPDIVLSVQEIESIKLNFLTHCSIIIKSVIMIPVSWLSFTIFYITGLVKIPTTVVNVIYLSEKVKHLVRQKQKE